MRYVIIRDDDTNASTPVECLERLYRPFLERGLPVNLAVIPDVATDATTPDGLREGFLRRHPEGKTSSLPIAGNPALVSYLHDNPGYHVLQHGCHHDCFEFGRKSPGEVSRRIADGGACLREAGWTAPETFVAPHDRLSPAAFREVARRFRVVSTGWFELRRLPRAWWPLYTLKKLRRESHWRIGRTLLLSHPGCLLSWHRRRDQIREQIALQLKQRRVTVLVTHWWEYFPATGPDESFIAVLHQTAEDLAKDPGVKVITFRDLVEDSIPLN